MCGIVGVLAAPHAGKSLTESALLAMRDSVAHRGPDDAGLWTDTAAGIGLGHRRLAIVDLSQQGHQPMASACTRFQLVFNGEIYNHLELRAELGEHPWRGHSDTETLLALFSRYGVIASLPKLVGMFAIAVWDRHDQVLTLVRDRLGEKPLYWGRLRDGSLAFASELRALRAHPQCQRDIDRNALALLLRYNCIPAPYSIYRSIQKLAPANWLELRHGAEPRGGHYWDLTKLASQGQDSPHVLDDTQAVDELERLLLQSVRGQMLADVPVGAFLSGGVDSSTVVAMMTRASRQPVRTFCIGFEAGATNEAEHARAVAQHLGTQHTELVLTGAAALATVPKLATTYDEPFADSSQIPTFLVAQMARQHVTVALSGDAGDELFAGYNRHAMAQGLWPRLARIPMGLRRAGAGALLARPAQSWDRIASWLQFSRPVALRHRDVGAKLHKLASQVLPCSDAAALYQALCSHWQSPGAVVLGSHEPGSTWQHAAETADWTAPANAMMLLDQLGYLPDDILVKVDRAAMAVSLETRAPLLDHRLVEFAWHLPLHQKLRGGTSKWVLRQLLYRYVPKSLIERPKQGFAVPLDAWLRGPLRDWAHDLIDPRRLRSEGYFDVEAVSRAWAAHLSGRENRGHQLWSILMFQNWLQGAAA